MFRFKPPYTRISQIKKFMRLNDNLYFLENNKSLEKEKIITP